MANGRSFAEVDAMTMAEVELIFDYWRDYPPANEIAAAVHQVGAFGSKPDVIAEVPEGCWSIEELKRRVPAMRFAARAAVG